MGIRFDYCSALRTRFDLFRRTLNWTPTGVNCNQTIAHGVYEKEKLSHKLKQKKPETGAAPFRCM
jgi:hypothetical protein